jgi:transcriptional regulator with XRE-family HTH domain
VKEIKQHVNERDTDSTAAERVGKRIRRARVARSISQAELARLIGVSTDRVSQYERGIRKPKWGLLSKIASILGVNVHFLSEPVISDELGAVYALFEMEDIYDLKLVPVDGNITLSFGKNVPENMKEYLKEWEKRQREYYVSINEAVTEEEQEHVKKEYVMWKMTFPEHQSYDATDIKRAELQGRIKKLQEELSSLDDNDGKNDIEQKRY